jgi:hypothetical protein
MRMQSLYVCTGNRRRQLHSFIPPSLPVKRFVPPSLPFKRSDPVPPRTSLPSTKFFQEAMSRLRPSCLV